MAVDVETIKDIDSIVPMGIRRVDDSERCRAPFDECEGGAHISRGSEVRHKFAPDAKVGEGLTRINACRNMSRVGERDAPTLQEA